MENLFWPAILLILLVCGIILFLIRRSYYLSSTPSESGFRFFKKDFPTPAEERFRLGLEYHLSRDYLICPQVALASFLGNRERKDFNSIRGKYIDFLIRRKDDMRKYFVIELNDSTHDGWDRIQRDRKLAEWLGDAGIPFVFHPVQKEYDFAELARHIKKYLG